VKCRFTRVVCVAATWIPWRLASAGPAPLHTKTSQAVRRMASARRMRLRESAANGNTSSAYQGCNQLTQSTPSSPAAPAGVGKRRVRQAAKAQTAVPASRTMSAMRRTAASAPPRPSAKPIRLGKL